MHITNYIIRKRDLELERDAALARGDDRTARTAIRALATLMTAGLHSEPKRAPDG